MAIHDELLDQADHLLTGPLGQGSGPCDADIRRAVSNAYYALFHFLVLEATALLCLPKIPRLATRFRRGFSHSGMKTVCVAVAVGASKMSAFFRVLFPNQVEPELAFLADAFETLQGDRHFADYDTNTPIGLGAGQDSVELARRAIAGWQTVKGTENANVFLTALAMHANWSKNN